jgi:riboflavin synthase
MFTGLIQRICMVKAVRRSGGTASLAVDLQDLAKQTKVGDSIAINGVCLTVAGLSVSSATFDISAETLGKTNLGKITSGSKVNIELAMRADERFGGHFVLGHIDGTATIKQIDRKGDFATISFTTSPELLGQMIPKGSVAVDGISLTIAEIDKAGFTIAVIPETLRKTTLGLAKTGDTVNIENDIITKTVRKQVEAILPRGNKLTVDKLQELGF